MTAIERQLSDWLRARFGPITGIAVAAVDRFRPIFPEEEGCIAGAVDRRRVEFSTGRWCAHQALAEIGIAPQPIGVGARMAPMWPENTCGSITHSGGLCAAAAALASSAAGIGIDVVELDEAQRILAASGSFIASETELAAALRDCAAPAASVLFSAKESAIKAMSAKFDRYVDFTEVDVRLHGCEFTAECRPFEVRAEGWWTVCGGYVFTAALRR